MSDDEQVFGGAFTNTQLHAPRGSDDAVVIPVRIDHAAEAEDEPTEALSGVEVRAVRMMPEEARDYALAILAAAGPNSDRQVRNYIAGQVIVTLDMPSDVEGIEVGPWLFIKPKDEEQFEDAVAVLGGLLAFEEPTRSARALHAYIADDSADAEAQRGMTVHVDFPEAWQPKPSPHVAAAERLAEKHREQREQVAEERGAAERITTDLIAEHTLTGRLLARLRELDRPVTTEELASAALVSAERAREGVTDLVNAGLVDRTDEDPPMLTAASTLGYHQELAPGPGKDGH